MNPSLDEPAPDSDHTAVLDASALLAFLQGEPGSDVVAPILNRAALSSVNWSEVVQKAIARGVDVSGLREDVTALGLHIMPFGAEDAEAAAQLWPATVRLGLSLGDRACIALGQRLQVTILTADQSWQTVPKNALGDGTTIRAIR